MTEFCIFALIKQSPKKYFYSLFPGIHQREVFLFNDILVITKIHSRKKNTVTYAFRQSHLLAAMQVNLFETQFYPYGIQGRRSYSKLLSNAL